jgi:phage baseplate assembly protein W
MASTSNNDFIGKGWSFPPSFEPALQSVAVTEQYEDIKRSLEILLSTRPGERLMQPKYGCNMEELLFESLDTGMKTLMADRIHTSILYFEPRIEVKKIELDDSNQNEGVVLIQIEYVVSATNTRFNFVYPYYKNEATEMNFLTINHPMAV